MRTMTLAGLLLWTVGCARYEPLLDPEVRPQNEPIPPAERDAGFEENGGEAGDPGGGDGSCAVLPPLTVELSLGDDQGWCREECHLEGLAEVIHKGSSGRWSSEVWFWMPANMTVLTAYANLPNGYSIPVEPGEQVHVSVVVQGFWWTDQSLTLRTPEGRLLFMQYVGDYLPPTVDTSCAEEVQCGRRVHPRVSYAIRETDDGSLLTEFDLDQGELRTVTGNLADYRVMLGVSEYFIRMDCDDYPDGWVAWAVMNSKHVSQCHCEDGADCSWAEVCDTHARRCVPDLCAAVDCGTGFVCDPFSSECLTPVGNPCDDQAGCDPDDEVCNQPTGRCVDNLCLREDCTPCSALAGGCYECLSDCDCGLGVCREFDRSCRPGCALDKLGFPPANPDQFELYYLCVRDILSPELATLLTTRFDDTLSCGTIGPAGTCSEQEIVCLAPLRYRPGTREIALEHWLRICALSRLPAVTGVVGGYWLP